MTLHGNWPVTAPAPTVSEEWELYEQIAAPGAFAYCGRCAYDGAVECPCDTQRDFEPDVER